MHAGIVSLQQGHLFTTTIHVAILQCMQLAINSSLHSYSEINAHKSLVKYACLSLINL